MISLAIAELTKSQTDKCNIELYNQVVNFESQR